MDDHIVNYLRAKWKLHFAFIHNWKYEIQQAVFFFFTSEKLAQAKEENLDMHQVLDQTLQELNNL